MPFSTQTYAAASAYSGVAVKEMLLAVVAPGAILTAGISGPDVSSSLQPVAQKSRAATNRLAK